MRLVANSINGIYMRSLFEEISASDCEGVTAAVAYLTWADDLIEFCAQNNLPLRLFCLFNADALPSPSPVERCLARSTNGWELWFTANYYHPKIVWFQGAGVYMGSANLTHNSWYSNVEAGVFFDSDEMARDSLDAQLMAFFETIRPRFRRAVREDLEAIKTLARTGQELKAAKEGLQTLFNQVVTPVPGSDAPAAVDRNVNPAKEAFIQDWTGTLDILRHTQERLALLHRQFGRRWVPATTPLAVEVGQALNFYYENHIHGVEQSAADAVERLHQQNSHDSQGVLDGMLREWLTAEIPDWIRALVVDSAPVVRSLLQPERLEHLILDDWKAICSRLHAALHTARQLSNVTLGKPRDTKATQQERVLWFAEFTWPQRSKGGHGLVEMLRYLIWNDQVRVEERVWKVVHEPDWKLPYLGISTAGEIIGLARPEDFPPRDNRDSRSLFALGFDVKRYTN